MLYGFGALIWTLLLAAVLLVVRDLRRDPNLQWFNGGEIPYVGYFLIIGGLFFLATYIFFVAPLVLLWPVESQRKHWYAMLCVALLWPPLFIGIIDRTSPSMIFQEIRRNLGFYGQLEPIALFACGCYLLLLRWQHARQMRKSTDQHRY